MPAAATTKNDAMTGRAPIDGEILLALVRELAAELRPGRKPRAALDSELEDDLGLDSLARMELLLRLQRRFGLSIAEEHALTAETPCELLAALTASSPTGPPAPVSPAKAPGEATPLTPPIEVATSTDALARFARHHGERVHIELSEADETTTALTYGDLFRDATRAAAGLLTRGVARGQSVALMPPTGRDFFVGFTAILLAGAVPVPIYPPFRASQLEEHLRRQALILKNARAVLLIGSAETARAARWLRGRVVDLRAVVTVEDLGAAGAARALVSRPSDGHAAGSLRTTFEEAR